MTRFGAAIVLVTVFQISAPVVCSAQAPTSTGVPAFRNPLESIGREHNNVTRFLLTSLKPLPKKNDAEKIIPETAIKYFEIRKIKVSVSGSALSKIAQSDPSKAIDLIETTAGLKAEAQKVIGLIEMNQTRGNFELQLTSLEVSAAGTLGDVDLYRYLSFTSVARSSDEFWRQEGPSLVQAATASASVPQITWWKVIAADALGALAGTLGGPLSAVAGGAATSAISVIDKLP